MKEALEIAIKKAQLRNIVKLIKEDQVDLFWFSHFSHEKKSALTCALEACQWQNSSWTGRARRENEYMSDYKEEFAYLSSEDSDPKVREIYQLLNYLYELYYIPRNPDEKHHDNSDSDISPAAMLFRKARLPDSNDILRILREVILIYLLVHQQDLLACCSGYEFPLFLPMRDEHLMTFLRGIYIDALLKQSDTTVHELDNILQQSLPQDIVELVLNFLTPKMNTELTKQLLLVACRSNFYQKNKLVWQLLTSEFVPELGKIKVYEESITALILAIRHKNYYAATQLIHYGADPCLAVKSITPLYMFILTLGTKNTSYSYEQAEECLKLLLEHGGRLQLKTPWMSFFNNPDYLPRQVRTMVTADREHEEVVSLTPGAYLPKVIIQLFCAYLVEKNIKLNSINSDILYSYLHRNNLRQLSDELLEKQIIELPYRKNQRACCSVM
jgi:hypothetical protein